MAATEIPKASSSPSSSSTPKWNYDVFLSFRDEDTRKNFTGHLYSALCQAGIHTFIDNNELERGEDITSELVEAIKQSRIALIIFSKNYADSRWCLDELVEIMQCRKNAGQMVVPIFYDADPSDVRKQTNSFALERHEKVAVDDKIGRWRTALTEVGNLAGLHLQNDANGHEQDFIKKIVEKILDKLNRKRLSIVDHPLVGIDSCLADMISLLSTNGAPDDVRYVGIYGMGGIGKTTIAKVIRNRISKRFEGSSLLEDIRETKQCSGMVHLQKKLLSEILHIEEIHISDVDGGINMIKDRLRYKRVLLILDDVDDPDQVNALARERDWFGAGSRIIITTRDQHLLNVINVDPCAQYEVPVLGRAESLQLFSWHAFREDLPAEDYVELSNAIVGYSGGLPLALKVYGSSLCDKTKVVWNKTSKKLKEIPNSEIQNKLRISYDALDDEQLKDIFLDIACFFIGMDKDDVIRILDGCRFYPEIGIPELTHRCLITISEDNKLRMHDLLRDMGRGIVREESPKEPEKRSRLWFHEDAHDVLTEDKGTEAIEGLILNSSASNELRLNIKAFARMHRLRLLQLNYVHLTGGSDHLFKELRWVCWHGFPLKSIPNYFHGKNLVAIDMQYSNLRQVWKENKLLEKLKVLNLSHSNYLTKTPDFSQLPNLEKLKLKDCIRLVEVHPSIGHLHRLVLLNVRDCKHLKNLPMSICMLKSLEILNISGCSKIEKLPENLGEMKALIELLANGTAIRQVPSSIECLTNLRNFSLSGFKGLPSSSGLGYLASNFWSWVSSRKSLDSISLLLASLLGLSSLKILRLRDCNLSDEAIPKDLGSLSSLWYLDLGGNNICSLPASINNLTKLQILDLDRCSRLQLLPELPTSLNYFSALQCTSLERLPNMSRFRQIPTLRLTNCHELVEIPGLEKYGRIHMEGCNNLANTFKVALLQVRPQFKVGSFLPGNEIPDWLFPHQSMGSSLFFQVPPILGRNLKDALAVCVVYAFDTVFDNTKEHWPHMPTTNDSPITRQDHMWVGHVLDYPLNGGDQVGVILDGEDGLIVKKCGVHLYDAAEWSTQSDGGELILYNSASNDNSIDVGEGNDDDVGPSHDRFDVDQHPDPYRCRLTEQTNSMEGYLLEFRVTIVTIKSVEPTSPQYISEDQLGSKAQRGRDEDDDEVGPSHGWSDEDRHPKRLRYQDGSAMDIDEE